MQSLNLLDEHFELSRANNAFDGINNKNENEVLLECSEDVPFSPLRQSYTPLPVNQPVNDLDENIVSVNCDPSDEVYMNECNNEVHIIDIKLQNQELVDAMENEPVDDSNVDTPISKEDIVLFTIDAANNGEIMTSNRLTVQIKLNRFGETHKVQLNDNVPIAQN